MEESTSTSEDKGGSGLSPKEMRTSGATDSERGGQKETDSEPANQRGAGREESGVVSEGEAERGGAGPKDRPLESRLGALTKR